MRFLMTAVLLLLSATTGAEPRFEAIAKDVGVMTQILKSALQDGKCRHCSVTSHYLAHQGVAFSISFPSLFGLTGDLDDKLAQLDDLDGARLADIPSIVQDALSSVDIQVDNLDAAMAADAPSVTGITDIDPTLRTKVRKLRTERRELERRLVEKQMNLIHLSNDEERSRLQSEIDELNDRLDTLRNDEKSLYKQVEAEREKIRAKRHAERERMEKSANEKRRQAEDVTLGALCNYGTTLKNIPDDEYISLIFDRPPSGKTDAVLVFKRAAIDGCHGPDDLRKGAVAYDFPHR